LQNLLRVTLVVNDAHHQSVQFDLGTANQFLESADISDLRAFEKNGLRKASQESPPSRRLPAMLLLAVYDTHRWQDLAAIGPAKRQARIQVLVRRGSLLLQRLQSK
jgi:hypothetical protein